MAKNFLVPIDMNGLEVRNFLAHNLAAAPTGVAGRIYFNTADHKLYYHNGTSWVALTADTDTKNTAGSTNSSSKLFIVGATSQAANPQTYSRSSAYVGTDGHLYSNSKQVVNLSDSQALTNKTYNGYTLAAASAKGVDTSITAGTSSTNLPTTVAVVDYVDDAISEAISASDAMIFKGTLGTGGTITALPTTYETGWTYRVITAGTYAGHTCEVGDLIIAVTERNGSGNLDADWVVAQTNITGINKTTASIGSASAGTAIAADDITAWTTNTPTQVTKKTVVTGGSTTAVPNISKKTVVTGVTPATVVTSASGASASYANGILTITNGSFGTGASATVTTGDSVTVGTAINAYTSLTTGDSVDVTAGTAASLSYTARSIPNISVTSKTVVTDVAFTTD